MTREAFEAFISAPPFEMPTERFDDRGAWPGGYTELEVDLAWQAWKAATDAAHGEIDKLQAQLVRQQKSYEAEIKVEIDAALERAAEICDRAEVFAWEQWKATGNLHTEGVSDGASSLARDIRALKESKE